MAKAAAMAGAEVILAGRSPERLEESRRDVNRVATGSPAATVLLDLSSFASVRLATTLLHEKWDALDVLVNNAGVMAIDEATGEDGYELTMTINHLSPVLLSAGVLDLLERGHHPRLSFTSSLLHWTSRLKPGLLGELHSPYHRWAAYAHSKAANLAVALDMDRRARAAHSPVTVLCAHPGVASTHLGHEGSGLTNSLLRTLVAPLTPSAERGSRSLVDAALSHRYSGGSFVGPRWLLAGPSHIARPSPFVARPRFQREVLERTLALVGAEFY